MIEDHLLQFLVDNSIGVIDQDLFLDELPFDTNKGVEFTGIALVPVGGRELNRVTNEAQFTIYGRGNSRKIKEKMKEIYRLIKSQDCFDLPPVNFTCCGTHIYSETCYKVCGVTWIDPIPAVIGRTPAGNMTYRQDFTISYSECTII